MEEILERQLIIRSPSFAKLSTFCATEKTLAGRKNRSCGPHVAREPYVMQAWSKGASTFIYLLKLVTSM